LLAPRTLKFRLCCRERANSVHWKGGRMGPRASLDILKERKSLTPAGIQPQTVQLIA